MVFLDLTGKLKRYTHNEEREKVFTLDKLFMKQIYDYIYDKYRDSIQTDDDGIEYMCIDNSCKNVVTLEELSRAYGNSSEQEKAGFRDSEYNNDRFFTQELFHLIRDLNIENENNLIFVGYFHANLHDYENSYKSSELAIKYSCAINKNYIMFNGEISPHRQSYKGGKISKKRKRNKKHRQSRTRNNRQFRNNV